MYRMLSLLVLFLFILEEVFHQKLGKSGRLSLKPTDITIVRNNFDRFDLVRLLELLLLGLLVSTPSGNPATGHGQLTMMLVGLQIARLFGRRVLSRWSVLGVLQALEVVLLLTIILVPVKSSYGEYPFSPLSLVALIGGVVYSIFVSITTAFSISYGVRLFAPESSRTYDMFPPLAGSESWAAKFSSFSLFAGIAGATGLILTRGISLLPLLFSVSLILQFAGVMLCKKETYNGHHPRAHVLWGVSFLIIYFLAVSGITTISSVPTL